MKTGFLQEKEFNPLENNLVEEVADFLITVSFVNIKNPFNWTLLIEACTFLDNNFYYIRVSVCGDT